MYSEIENLAKLIVEHSVEVKKGERVIIDGDPTGTPLLHLCLHREILRKGGIPFHKSQLGDLDYVNLKYAKEYQLRTFAEDDTRMVEDTDIIIGIEASANPRRVEAVNPKNIRRFQRAAKICRDAVAKRSKAGKLRLFFVNYPTNGMAQEHGMPLLEYEDHFCKACFLDRDNPIKEWEKFSKEQERYTRFLETKHTIHVEGEDTDLTFSTKAEEGKRWTSDNGKKYLPDGEIYADHIIRDSVNGSIAFTYPGIFRRKEIQGIELKFKDGKIVNAESSTEEKFLQNLLLANEGEVYLSAFGIGTNYRIDKFIGQMDFDEKMGGTIHLTLRGSPSWVLLKRMGENERIYAADEAFYDNGVFLI